LAGHPRSASAADSVMAIEIELARAHWDRVRNRQAELTYNLMTLDEITGSAPGLDWATYMRELGVQERQFVVAQPDFLTAFAELWDAAPLQEWQDYYSFKTLDAFAAYLSSDFVQASFDFKGRVLGGQQELEARWRRGVSAVDGALPEVVGKLYVENHFREEAKHRMD